MQDFMITSIGLILHPPKKKKNVSITEVVIYESLFDLLLHLPLEAPNRSIPWLF